MVGKVVERLSVPEALDGDVSPRSRRWWAQSIAHGAAGVAIMHAAMDHTGANHTLVHRWLTAAVTVELSAAPGAGAWFGVPAVGFAIEYAATRYGGYQRARTALRASVDRIVRERLDEANRRIVARTRPRLQEFDLVNGLTGLGGYLLWRDPTHPLVAEVLTYLVALVEPLDADDPAGTAVPGWWTSTQRHGQVLDCGEHRDRGSAESRLAAPGFSDQGMAHGIAGPLSLLALAGRAGIWVSGQREAMQHIGAWYEQLACADDQSCWWPQRHTGHEHPTTQLGPGQPSWCYGTPGIARALQLSGIALGEQEHRRRAECSLLAAATDPILLAQISDGSLCHGWAGTALTVWHAAQDCEDPTLTATLQRALASLIDSLTTTLSADLDAVGGAAMAESEAGVPIGLIQGIAGAALTAHALSANHVDGWARCLLLA